MKLGPSRAGAGCVGPLAQARAHRRLATRTALRLALTSTLLMGLSCGSDPSDPAGQQQQTLDTDGDGVPDSAEGRDSALDTDADGIPDYRDLDSDGDGIADSVEMGDLSLTSTPLDADGDGTPDYLDTDADGDGILDTDELGASYERVDTDGDGTPDDLDSDSDGDTIADDQESGKGEGLAAGQPLTRGVLDADGDGVPDFRDLDTDGDGISDSCEAGDADPATPAFDRDGDGSPDFRDLDSDDDGVPDADEDANGNCVVDPGESSPQSTDSDGDGVTDVVERVAGSDPSDPTVGIPSEDFYFVLPYQRQHGGGQLDFATDVRQADVFFSIDNTGSMEGETANIQANLVTSIIPQVTEVIPSVAFGLGRFRDFPLDPHGLTGDLPYQLIQPVTTSSATIGTAINALPAPLGGLDVPESGFEALYQWATGAGVPTFGYSAFQSNAPSGIGGAGFRPGSLPIIVHITDAVAHDPADYSFSADAHGRDQTVAALSGIGARVIGINSLENVGTEFEPRTQLEDLAVASRAMIPPDENGECLTGVAAAAHESVTVDGAERCPLVFDVETDGSGLSNLIVDAIEQLATLADLDVSTRAIGKLQGEAGEALPEGTTSANFIKSIVPVPPAPDGASIEGDIFKAVHPGSTVRFELDAYNDFVPHTDRDQLFTIQIQVLGDGVTVLDTRTVYVIVPKRAELPTIIR